MERQPHFQPDNSGNNVDGKSKKKTAGGINATPGSSSNVPEIGFSAQAERRRVPVAPPLEGVISWRRDEEVFRQSSVENNKPEDDKVEAETTLTPKQEASLVQPDYLKQAPHSQGDLIAEQTPQELPDTIEAAHEGDDKPKKFSPRLAAFPKIPLASRTLSNFEPPTGHQEQLVSQQVLEANDEEVTQGIPAVSTHSEQTTHAYTGEAEQSVDTSDESQQLKALDEASLKPVAVNTIPGYAPGVTAPNSSVIFNQAPTAAPGTNYNAIPFAPIGNQIPTPNTPPMGPNASPSGPGNTVPPTPNQPSYNFSHSPNNPYNPAHNMPNYNAAPAVPVMPIERPVVTTHNRDPRVGVVAAFLGLEYFARKRADRKLEKRVNKRSEEQFKKQERQTARETMRLQEQQRRFENEQQRQAKEMHQMRYGQEPVATHGLPRPFETPTPLVSANQSPSYQRVAVERVPTPPIIAPEIRQQQIKTVEHLQPESMDDQQPLALKQGQHVEHSAWHNIVVDEKGHEVTGAIVYGEGFQSERQQEAIRDRVADTSSTNAGAASGAVFGQQRDQFGNPMLPSGMTSPALPQGQSTHADPQHQLPSHNSQPSNFTNPWFWIMLLLIIAAFFTAALV